LIFAPVAPFSKAAAMFRQALYSSVQQSPSHRSRNSSFKERSRSPGTGATVGGLLDATFGNPPELIIAVVALRAGLLEMVRASIVGALLANDGSSIRLQSREFRACTWDANAARISAKTTTGGPPD
jgi:hypothetical protein